jgi:hypothetical protein
VLVVVVVVVVVMFAVVVEGLVVAAMGGVVKEAWQLAVVVEVVASCTSLASSKASPSLDCS